MTTRPVIISGLTRDVYVVGSKHTAPAPRLVRNVVDIEDDDAVDMEWEARGSKVYTVTAKGRVSVAGRDERDSPSFDPNAFVVRCNCPDGERQRIASLESGRLHVCKHGAAALESALDRERAKRKPESSAQKPSATTKRAKKQRGETAEEEGDWERCGRCHRGYNPLVASDRICRIRHPRKMVHKTWESSKKSFSYCGICGKGFNLQGYHVYGRMTKGAPFDEGRYCFEGEHVPEGEYDREKDEIIWKNGDLAGL